MISKLDVTGVDNVNYGNYMSMHFEVALTYKGYSHEQISHKINLVML